MKRVLYLVLFLLVGFICSMSLLSPNKSISNVKAVEKIPLGNKLSAYFYYVNTKNIANRHLPKYYDKDIANVNDPALKNFYKHMQWQTRKNRLNYESVPEGAHAQLSDAKPKANYLQFWQTVRPQMQEFYKRHLQTNLTADPVVHFRCSDSPFNKHAHYHITKAATVDWMAQQLVARGYKQITLLNCNQYRSLDQQSCAKYVAFYKQIFESAGLQVTQQCNSVLHDFELMVSAPVLVSLNYSSYSFMAGIAKDPVNYISCNGGQEYNDEYVLQTEADWLLSYDVPLLHKDVLDYNDAEDVIARLKH